MKRCWREEGYFAVVVVLFLFFWGFCFVFLYMFDSLFWFGFVLFNFHLEGCCRREDMEKLNVSRIGLHGVKLPKIQ